MRDGESLGEKESSSRAIFVVTALACFWIVPGRGTVQAWTYRRGVSKRQLGGLGMDQEKSVYPDDSEVLYFTCAPSVFSVSRLLLMPLLSLIDIQS